jgi:hypothetical protein
MLEEVSVDCVIVMPIWAPKAFLTLQKQRRSDDITKDSGRYTEIRIEEKALN